MNQRQATAWIEANKTDRPFAAGALAYITGQSDYYGCHFGMRSTKEACRELFAYGWRTARQDERLAADL